MLDIRDMARKIAGLTPRVALMSGFLLMLNGCAGGAVGAPSEAVYPSDVIPFMDEFKIMLGNGATVDSLVGYEHDVFFYVSGDSEADWVVYKTPNVGTTSRNSSNTRTELHQHEEWTPEEGGRLTGTLKVMHVSTSGDARVAASYSTVVGQIHSGEGHENEPLKIFYKKFPGHDRGSVFWNYEINTAGDANSGRWDYSSAVWGHDMSVVGSGPAEYPEEPEEGIRLGEEFSYEVEVREGVMHLAFASAGRDTVRFVKSLVRSDYATEADIPEQTRRLFGPIGREGVERERAYAGESMYFKQGAYNQTNAKEPGENIVWNAGAEAYGGRIDEQYENGAYTEVWFRSATVGAGPSPGEE
jgi:hypothetical protein